ncbi:hypothetical protein F2P81_020816 [Scophthalmus maximus]|uniref:Uncharacterized protein n=1 Tax=Scophthalmus maximus TaxID=52904 RepID=A0A6A4S0M6_SCOMX|nr:hypothetical protein F2P81_020816 [Scophthalmus maximus]
MDASDYCALWKLPHHQWIKNIYCLCVDTLFFCILEDGSLQKAYKKPKKVLAIINEAITGESVENTSFQFDLDAISSVEYESTCW